LTTLNLGGGTFNFPASTSVSVTLDKGVNSITFGNAATWAADLDRIVISGDGDAVPPVSTTYEAEAAVMAGKAGDVGCSFCSSGGRAGYLGGEGNTVTFTNVIVPRGGLYAMEVDYLTIGPRSFHVAVNGEQRMTLNLNGSSFESPAYVVVSVFLQAGTNTIQFTNPTANAPDLDCITIGPVANKSSLCGAILFTNTNQFTNATANARDLDRITSSLCGVILSKNGTADHRIWRLALMNPGLTEARQTRLNSFTLVGINTDPSCQAFTLLPMPLFLGTIAPSSKRIVDLSISFTPGCSDHDSFSVHAVFSANNGADVGTLEGSGETM